MHARTENQLPVDQFRPLSATYTFTDVNRSKCIFMLLRQFLFNWFFTEGIFSLHIIHKEIKFLQSYSLYKTEQTNMKMSVLLSASSAFEKSIVGISNEKTFVLRLNLSRKYLWKGPYQSSQSR